MKKLRNFFLGMICKLFPKKEKTKTWKEVLEETAQDPEFLKAVETFKNYGVTTSGEDVHEIISPPK